MQTYTFTTLLHQHRCSDMFVLMDEQRGHAASGSVCFGVFPDCVFCGDVKIHLTSFPVRYHTVCAVCCTTCKSVKRSVRFYGMSV